MAIAFVQSIETQVTAATNITFTVPGVAAGNFLAVQTSVFDVSGPPNATPSDGTNTWNTTTAPTVQSNTNTFINYAMNVASGSPTITIDYGNDTYAIGEASEWSGMATSSTLDVQAQDTSAADTTPTVGPTATTAQADELVLASISVGTILANVALTVPATTGYTNFYVQQNNQTNQAGSGDHKIVAATGTQSAAWGTFGGALSWSTKIATFKAAGGAAPTLPVLPIIKLNAVRHAANW